jgi:hypothetical protein
MFTVTEFVSYVESFYGENGIYPFTNLKTRDITIAVNGYIGSLGEEEFCADSVDRERVRDILLKTFYCESFSN